MRFYIIGKSSYMVLAPRPLQAGRIGWAEAHPTYLTERQELLLAMFLLLLDPLTNLNFNVIILIVFRIELVNQLPEQIHATQASEGGHGGLI